MSGLDFEPDKCEWNPRADRPARDDDEPHGDATVCVGADGEWHLCESCAVLPHFARFTTREPLRRPGGTV